MKKNDGWTAFQRSCVTTSAIIPVDDTIPQAVEGLACLSVVVPPLDEEMIISIEAVLYLTHSSIDALRVVALFEGQESNAIACVIHGRAVRDQPVKIAHTMSITAHQLRQFTVRVGSNSAAGTLTINSGDWIPSLKSSPMSILTVELIETIK